MNKGICSVTFRYLKPQQIIDLCKETNLNCIEWGGDVHVPVDNLDNAKAVKELTKNNGVSIFSFGSYFKCTTVEEFEKVSITAYSLDAKIIRIWAGNKDAEYYTEEEFINLVNLVKKCAEIAKSREQIIAFEFHFGTYNNKPENSLKLLKAINMENVKTYWQPMYWLSYASSDEEIKINVDSINQLKQYIVCAHVYSWKGVERFPLIDGVNAWQNYVKNLPNVPMYLEFIKNDDVKQFYSDVDVFVNKIN